MHNNEQRHTARAHCNEGGGQHPRRHIPGVRLPLFVSSNSVISGVQNGFTAGTYNVHETQQGVYPRHDNRQLRIQRDDNTQRRRSEVMPITNVDPPTNVIVIKHVNNNYGGTATAGQFTLNLLSNGTKVIQLPGQRARHNRVRTSGQLPRD